MHGQESRSSLLKTNNKTSSRVSRWSLDPEREATQEKETTNLFAYEMSSYRQSRSPQPVMTPGVPHQERMMSANCNAHSCEAQRPTTTEAIQAFCKREDTLSVLADPVLFKEHRAEEEDQIRAKRIASVSQAMMRPNIAGISGFMEDALTALVTPNGHKGVKRTENRLQDILQGLVNKIFDERLDSV